jgi:hypothetical protein
VRKFGVFAATIFIVILISGIYGIIHDQITYTISPEYFSKFKYSQFGFEPNDFGGHRQTVAAIGFLATWWVGIPLGVLLALTGLIFPDHKTMRRAITKGVFIIFLTAIASGFIGYLWGKYHLVNTGVNWWMPAGLIDRTHFIIVGSIHNFSYLGGGLGLLFAIIYMIVKKSRTKRHHATT